MLLRISVLWESKKLLDAVHVEASGIVVGATKLCSIDRLFMVRKCSKLGEITLS